MVRIGLHDRAGLVAQDLCNGPEVAGVHHAVDAGHELAEQVRVHNQPGFPEDGPLELL